MGWNQFFFFNRRSHNQLLTSLFSFSFFISVTISYNSLPVNILPNTLAPKVPNNIPNHPSFCYFLSFLIVLVATFNKILECSGAWQIFIMPFPSSLEIIEVVVPKPCIIFWIPASIAEAGTSLSMERLL